MIKKLLLFMLFICPLSTSLFGDIAFTFGQSASYLSSDPDKVATDSGIQAGYDLYLPASENFSLFASLDGLLNYRYLENEWRYRYDAAFDLSFRSDKILIKPSLNANGEQIYMDTLVIPDIFENTFELYMSYDLETSTLFLSPCFSWENYNFFVKGKTGYSFSIFTNYIFSLAFSAGKTIPGSENDEFFLVPEAGFSWFPDSPFTLNTVFTYTWYDSDYLSIVGAGTSPLYVFDFSGFSLDIDFSISLSSNVTLSIFLPLDLTLKRHDAVRSEIIEGEAEWFFTPGIQTDIAIDFPANHRCIFSLTGENTWSNSTYQESGEVMLTAAYEFLF